MKYMIEFDLPDNDTVLREIKTADVAWGIWGYSGCTKAKPAQRWIPCSTALPELDGTYLVTKRSFGWNCKEYIEIDIARYEKKNGWHKADEVLAWCELPTPYREGGLNE